MRQRWPRLALVLLVVTGIAAALALTHMDNLPAYIVIAPGYLVQAWLFEHHHALGGFGYQLTMVGMSTLVWTLILFCAVAGFQWLARGIRHLSPGKSRQLS